MKLEEYYQSVEAEVKREVINDSPLKKLLPIYRRIQGRIDQNTDITLKEYREITGHQWPKHLKIDR